MNKAQIGIVIIVLLSLASTVEAKTYANEKEDYTFLDFRDIVNKTNNAQFAGGDWHWFYNGRSYNAVYPADMLKDFWMPIAPWEYEVCTRGLSTQLTYDQGAGAGSIFSGIYDDTVTVAAYRRTPERNVESDPRILYEVSWYFHPANEGKYYSIKMIGPQGEKVLQETSGASKKNGASGYSAFYSSVIYTKIILYDESTPKQYEFNIVNTTDPNR